MSVKQHQDKLFYLLKVICILMMAHAALLTIYFAIEHIWYAALIKSLFIPIGFMGYKHLIKGNFKEIKYVYTPLTISTLCVYSLFIDVPTESIPRSNHNHFIPAAVFYYYMFQNDHRYIRFCAVGLTLLAFLVFSSTNFGISLATFTYQEGLMLIWYNNVYAIIVLFLVALIFQSDFKIRHGLEIEFSKALLNNNICFYFQPQINQHNKVFGAEILARWEHPTLGNVPPHEFIPLAEKTGLILDLGKRLLMVACHQLAIWEKNPTTSHLTLSVNISIKQFRDMQFVQDVIAILDNSKVDARKLQLEITESIFEQDLTDISNKMAQLKSHGVKFSLDDFGTGYSSLAYVKNLPLDELKIDKSFVKDMLSDTNNANITKMIISLARELNISTIAEGVETLEQRDFLIANNCSNFQGHLFSPALPIDDFETFVHKQYGGSATDNASLSVA